jgi:CTP synthase
VGLQVAVIEFARNACGLDGANSTEFDKGTPHPVISLLEEQKGVTDMGASMRLGTKKTLVREGTIASRLYGREEISERHRHRYEFNSAYREQMEAAGLVISGTSPDGALVEMIELRDHPWFVACQFHPEFQSKPNAPHPLFSGFVAACLGHRSS